MTAPPVCNGLLAPTPDLIARFSAIVGAEHALTDSDQQLPYLREMRDLYHGRSPVVLRPGTVEQVQRIMALANEARVAIVPQAGNTGLVGAQIPYEGGTEVVLSIARLNRLRGIDPAGLTMTVEAGMTLADCQAAAEEVDRLFPLSLPSQGSCRIGGNIATNAGGVAVLAYGNMRQLVLGLEVVLADGRLWNGLKALKKDNTGYDLRDLFIGSEGTLGIITAAVLKLFPRPAEKATAFVALPSIEATLDLFTRALAAAGTNLTAFEFMARSGLEMVDRHIAGARVPLAMTAPWYVLLEISGAKEDGATERTLESVLADAAEHGIVTDAVIARSLAQAAKLWRLREELPDAQKPEGGSLKHDLSVAVARIPEFIAHADQIVERMCPGARPVPFGHFGDGNVHYNITEPPGFGRERFLQVGQNITAAIHDLVVSMAGSISAEHGIGRMKRAELQRFKDPVELDLMRRIKAVFDPNGILNPGKVL
ncbi:MAG TPA: FAD-binding oxidoreductase [Hyphomicrobiaceae bacterium]|nr:FAD-binding oxidoreductase [Hyphomicrobiaceae bacterium]